MAQASKAIVPKDSHGPFGQRIGVSTDGNLSWGLRVGAYVTGRNDASDWQRYSLVVMNWSALYHASQYKLYSRRVQGRWFGRQGYTYDD